MLFFHVSLLSQIYFSDVTGLVYHGSKRLSESTLHDILNSNVGWKVTFMNRILEEPKERIV